MADNNIEIQRLQEALDAFTEALTGTTSSMTPLEREYKKQQEALKKYEEQLKEAHKKQYESVQRVTGAVTQHTKSFMAGAGSFSVLNSVVDLTSKLLGGVLGAIPVVGGAMKAFGEAAGDVTKMMIEQFQVGWNAYKDLQDVGLVNSFENLKDTASKTGLLYQDVNTALGKYSTNIASFGGTMAKGMESFSNTARDLEGARKKFNAFGIGAAEFTEYQAKYTAQETKLGRARNQDLVKGTQEYILQLDAISKITGLSRKDLQAQRDAAMSETRFRASMEGLPKHIQENFNTANSILISKGHEPFAQGLRDLASGATATEAARQMMTQTGGKAQEIADKVRSGMITGTEAVKLLQDALKENLPAMQASARYTGDASIATKDFAKALDFARAELPTEEDIAAERKAQADLLEGRKKETTALANVENQLYATSTNLQLLFTSSENVTTAMSAVSGALDKFSAYLAGKSGGTTTTSPSRSRNRNESVRAASRAVAANEVRAGRIGPDEAKAILENGSPRDVADFGGREALEKIAASAPATPPAAQTAAPAKPAQVAPTQTAPARTAPAAPAQAAPAQAAPAAPAQAQPQAPSKPAERLQETPAGVAGKQAKTPLELSLEQVKNAGLRVRPHGDVWQGGPLSNKGLEVAKAIQSSIPGFGMFTGLNDVFHQQKHPNSSHTKGRGIDFTMAKVPTQEEAGGIKKTLQGIPGVAKAFDEYYADKNKWTTGGHFHVDAQARTGGIFKGPSTGYQVTLHGEEMVIPGQEGVSKQALGTSMFDTDTQSQDRLISLFETVLERQDMVIDLLDDNNNNSKKLVNAMV